MNRPFLLLAAMAMTIDGAALAAIAIERSETKAVTTLDVSSPAFAPGGAIPKAYSAYGDNKQPAIAWRAVPRRTKSFALIVEDPDAKTPAPFVHWVVYDIPGSSIALTEVGAGTKGNNGRGAPGWAGPHPPAGSGLHHYHFQLFALDKSLGLKPGATRDELIAAMKGRVLAKGELVGTYPAP